MDETEKVKAGMVITIFSAVVFGIYPAACQAALNNGASISAVIIITTFIRAIALSLFCIVKTYKLMPDNNEIKSYVSGGFFQAISLICILGSLAFIPGPVTITIVFTHTIMLLFLLAFKGEQKFTLLALFSSISALIGVSFVVNFWNATATNLDSRGLVLAFCAALATTSRLYVFGKQLKNTNPAVVGARIFIVTSMFTLLIMFFEFPTIETLKALQWILICSAALTLGTFGMFYGIAYLGSFRFSLLVKSEPLFTAIFAFFILNQTLNSLQYMGIFLVLASLLVFNIKQKQTA